MRRALPLLLLPLLLAPTGCGDAVQVEAAPARRGALEESFTEPARTWIERTHLVGMPLGGRLGAVELEPGDRVRRGQLLAEVDLVPLQAAVQEARAAVRELEARLRVNRDEHLELTALEGSHSEVTAAEKLLEAAEAQVQAEAARAERARKELGRVEPLVASKALPQQHLDDARLAAETSVIELRERQFTRAAMTALVVAIRLGPRFVKEYLQRKQLEGEAITHQLAQARERLRRAEHDLGLARLSSPVDGVVLERHDRGERFLPPGAPLLRIADLGRLEVVAEVLSEDALRLTTGSPVELTLSPGSHLSGRVRRVEPFGFTKPSSLGVEEQRVRVVVAPEEPPAELGVGYRVLARFVTGRSEDTLAVPRAAVLEDVDGGHYLFVVEDGALVRRPVRTGLSSDREWEVLEGLAPEEPVVTRADTSLEDGQAVELR